MKTKDIIIGFIIIVAIFLSYYFLNPISQDILLAKEKYILKTHNVGKENKWSSFNHKSDGTFFVHPGKDKASSAVFTFKNPNDLSLDFWIAKGSKNGNIEFNLTKNGIPIDSIVVTAKTNKSMPISVNEGDELIISADKHGALSQDWGKMKIRKIESIPMLKNFIIPFLWSMLIIFLLGRKYKYVAVASYLLFLLMIFAEKINFNALSFQNILTYTVFIFALTFLFVFIYQELWRLKKFKVATLFSFSMAFLVYTIPLFFIIYVLNFNAEVTKDILFAIFQSNPDESYEFISDNISPFYIALFIIFTFLVGFLLYRQEKKEAIIIEKSLLLFIIISFLSISMVQFSQLKLPNFLLKGLHSYEKELRLFKQVQEKRKTGEIKFAATKSENDETYIIVIGESLNKKHMGIYGYLRKTTPNLTKMKTQNELLLFNNTYSNNVYTIAALSQALTESNQYNKKNYYDSVSIIEILKKAKIENYWLTNQMIYGTWENLVSVIGASSDNLVAFNKHIGESLEMNKYDGVLIDEVKKTLAKKCDKTRVIFVHLMGSHSRYESRYPHDKFAIYKDSLKVGEYGTKASKNKKINDYDNSIAYNDYVVGSMLNALQNVKGVTGFVYMSDHSEDAIDDLQHHISQFTFEMTQIPMIVWFSDAYKKRYPEKFKTLQEHTKTLFSNDMWYDTLIGMIGISTDKYNAKYDLTSKEYTLKPKDALTLHGKKHYTDKNNYIYWQKTNAKYLFDSNQSSRVFPGQVDTAGKLRDIWNNGFRSFEVDVRFGDKNQTTFIIGRDKDMGDIKLDKLLTCINKDKIQRILLNLKNMDKKNYTQVLERLEYLNNKYNIKEKCIVQSGTPKELFRLFRNKGWHTSYYLPTDQVINLLKNNNVSVMENLSKEIAHQAEIQKLSGVSFDHRLYPFVKTYLEPKISDDIAYHSWYAPALYDSNFKNELLKNKLYLNDRVKTLLASYRSQFE